MISFITKKMRFLAQNVIVEALLIFVFALGSFFCSRMLVKSGTVSLLTTSIIMSHYAWHNLSPQGKHVTSVTFQTIGYGAEALIYCFVGLSTATVAYSNEVSFAFVGLELALVIVGRFLIVFVLYFICRSCSKSESSKLSLRELLYISYAAFTKGSIAFGLVSRLDLDLRLDASVPLPSIF